MPNHTPDIIQLQFQLERSPVEKRFWDKINRDAPNGCWLWTACISVHGGYGLFMYEGRLQVAHRVAWKLLIGPIPGGLKLCHDCPDGDNPACVNPDHLFLGTQKDNIRDCISKGRRAEPYKPLGRLNPNNKLSVADVQLIRNLASSNVSFREIGRRFGVSHHTVSGIVRREWYAWIP